ncbi:hypothetical protein GCM10028818_42200 [Spirosoma horti]
MQNQTLFFEKQYLRQWPVIGLLVVINLFFFILFLLQSILGHPLGTKVAPNVVLILLLIGSWLLTYFTLTANLTTTINSLGISYQFAPFQRRAKLIGWHQIKSCYIRTYSPLKEYGGWGYGNYPKNKAYTVSGVVGIQLVLHTGEFVLIGTTKGAQAQAALESIYDVAH